MRNELVQQWREEIVGDWQSELAGIDLLDLRPSARRYTLTLSFRSDGTAERQLQMPNYEGERSPDAPPFPTTWELSEDRVLSIWVPVPPEPDSGDEIPEWNREQICHDVLAVTERTLAISNRRFDGEEVIILRRLNDKEGFCRRRSV